MLVKGCYLLVAEMIPSEPDTDNADAGMIEYDFPLFYRFNK